jgi:hypothetical protein
MKKFGLVFCLVLVIYCSNVFGQSESIKVERILNNSNQTTSDSCPVGPATNPFPENGTTNIDPYYPVNANWINGENTTNIEIYFGVEGNMVSYYSGSPISSLTIYYPFDYSTVYQWKVICKNDTCSAESETWSFTTGTEPGVLFSEHFNSLSKWTAIGPVGQTNWVLSNWGLAGGEPPELKLNWTPIFNGISRIISDPIFYSRGEHGFTFTQYCNLFFNPAPTLGIAITYDAGLTSTILWQFQPDNQNNIGEIVYFNIPIQSVPYQLILFADGNSNNIEGWFVDDIEIHECLGCLTAPSNLSVIENWENGPNAILNWNDNSVELGFEIFRGSSDTNNVGSLIAIVPENTIHYIDSTVVMDSIYSYRVRAIYGPAFSNFSNAALIEITIPVELTSFTSSVYENDVTINWQTATEKNNSGFEIQRTTLLNPLSRGEAEGRGVWRNIGFVNGTGTTTEPQSYSFVDKDLEAGKYQYRLKQIDFDGSFEYSKTIEVEVNAPLKFSLEQNYPNPFNPSTTIKFSIPAVGTRLALSVQLKVYDVLGKEVATLVNKEKPAGNYEVLFTSHSDEGQNLPSGVYFYQLKAEDFIQTKKMILLK